MVDRFECEACYRCSSLILTGRKCYLCCLYFFLLLWCSLFIENSTSKVQRFGYKYWLNGLKIINRDSDEPVFFDDGGVEIDLDADRMEDG